MAARQKNWARKQRNILHFLLGNKCSVCGSKEKLQLDCKEPQGNEHHRKMAWDCRMRFYWKQFYIGNLDLKCSSHNGFKGATEDKAYHHSRRYTQTSQIGA